jgi:hypothetical protein
LGLGTLPEAPVFAASGQNHRLEVLGGERGVFAPGLAVPHSSRLLSNSIFYDDSTNTRFDSGGRL